MKLPRVTGDKVVKALKRAGFVEIRQRGSHSYLYHEQKDRLVTVPVHAGKIIAPKTLKSILKQAGLGVDALKELL
jgi:predicted RNA binding protein YcfA (HicA-like mRNA interferase family)